MTAPTQRRTLPYCDKCMASGVHEEGKHPRFVIRADVEVERRFVLDIVTAIEAHKTDWCRVVEDDEVGGDFEEALNKFVWELLVEDEDWGGPTPAEGGLGRPAVRPGARLAAAEGRDRGAARGAREPPALERRRAAGRPAAGRVPGSADDRGGAGMSGCGINTADGACPNEAGEHGITVTRDVDGQMVANRTAICDEHYLLLRATIPSARDLPPTGSE